MFLSSTTDRRRVYTRDSLRAGRKTVVRSGVCLPLPGDPVGKCLMMIVISKATHYIGMDIGCSMCMTVVRMRTRVWRPQLWAEIY